MDFMTVLDEVHALRKLGIDSIYELTKRLVMLDQDPEFRAFHKQKCDDSGVYVSVEDWLEAHCDHVECVGGYETLKSLLKQFPDKSDWVTKRITGLLAEQRNLAKTKRNQGKQDIVAAVPPRRVESDSPFIKAESSMSGPQRNNGKSSIAAVVATDSGSAQKAHSESSTYWNLKEENARLKSENAQLKIENDKLRAELNKLKRKAKKQLASA